MNLRDFKKDIEYVIGDFIEDCANFIYRNPDKATDDVYAIVDEACELFDDLRDKANKVPESGRKAYYNTLRKDLVEKVDGLYEKLSSKIQK